MIITDIQLFADGSVDIIFSDYCSSKAIRRHLSIGDKCTIVYHYPDTKRKELIFLDFSTYVSKIQILGDKLIHIENYPGVKGSLYFVNNNGNLVVINFNEIKDIITKEENND